MIGACIYCGQMGAVEAINEEAAIKITTKTCDCIEARKARRQEEMEAEEVERRANEIEKACRVIKTMFGEDSEESHMERTNDEVIEELMTIVIMIIDRKLSEIQIKLPSGAKGKISKNASGNIVIQRSKGIAMKQEI